MLNFRVKPTSKAATKLVAVIKNGHTDAELDDMEERWTNHKGPHLTLAQVLAIEAEKAAQQDESSSS